VIKAAIRQRAELSQAGGQVEIECVGKRGLSILRFLQIPVTEKTTDVEDKIEYARVAAMAERYIRRYIAGEIGRVDVAYTRFVSTAVQKAEMAQLLPIEPPQAADADKRESKLVADFEFSPEPAKLLERLIPEAVKIRLFQYLNDSIVSEQVSRMVAMKAATDSAADMIKYLSRQYNRARQSQITSELADIVGGAEAVK
jgi:F-type H+-transporting ATPase subunit gamma